MVQTSLNKSHWPTTRIGRFALIGLAIVFCVFVGWIEYNKFLRQEALLQDIDNIPKKEIDFIRLAQYPSELPPLPTDVPLKCFMLQKPKDKAFLASIFLEIIRKAPPFPLRNLVNFQLTFVFSDGTKTDLLGTVYEKVEDDVYFVRNMQNKTGLETQHAFRIQGQGPWFMEKLKVGIGQQCL